MPGYAVELYAHHPPESPADGWYHCGWLHYPIRKQGEQWRFAGELMQGVGINSTERPPLIFETEEEADLACEYFYLRRSQDQVQARPREVDKKPTHTLSNDGIEAIPMEGSLFNQST